MNITIKSTKLKKEFSFWMNGERGYVFLESKGRPGCLGDQICDGGRFMGNTISANAETFERECRKWLRSYIKNSSQFE